MPSNQADTEPAGVKKHERHHQNDHHDSPQQPAHPGPQRAPFQGLVGERDHHQEQQQIQDHLIGPIQFAVKRAGATEDAVHVLLCYGGSKLQNAIDQEQRITPEGTTQEENNDRSLNGNANRLQDQRYLAQGHTPTSPRTAGKPEYVLLSKENYTKRRFPPLSPSPLGGGIGPCEMMFPPLSPSPLGGGIGPCEMMFPPLSPSPLGGGIGPCEMMFPPLSPSPLGGGIGPCEMMFPPLSPSPLGGGVGPCEMMFPPLSPSPLRRRRRPMRQQLQAASIRYGARSRAPKQLLRRLYHRVLVNYEILSLPTTFLSRTIQVP